MSSHLTSKLTEYYAFPTNRSGLLMICALSLLLACTTVKSTASGGHDDKLPPCPASPNCVSSDATDEAHRVESYRLLVAPASKDGRPCLKSSPRCREPRSSPRPTLTCMPNHAARSSVLWTMWNFNCDRRAKSLRCARPHGWGIGIWALTVAGWSRSVSCSGRGAWSDKLQSSRQVFLSSVVPSLPCC